jgi:hypothetical protein
MRVVNIDMSLPCQDHAPEIFWLCHQIVWAQSRRKPKRLAASVDPFLPAASVGNRGANVMRVLLRAYHRRLLPSAIERFVFRPVQAHKYREMALRSGQPIGFLI